MRDIRDPENPYRDRYGEWDVWAYLNEVSVRESQGVVNLWVDHPGWEQLRLGVDENGWLVPQLESRRRELERMKYGGGLPEGEAPCTHSITARGKPSPRMMQELERQQQQLTAAYYPPVPVWLTELVPQWAILLPSGEVVACGMPGSDDEFLQAEGIGARCYRFSASGELLAATEPGQDWPNLFFDLDGVMEQYQGEQYSYWIDNGWVQIRELVEDPEGRYYKVIKVLDYDGTPAKDIREDEPRDNTRFTEISGPNLLEIYDIQQGVQATGV